MKLRYAIIILLMVTACGGGSEHINGDLWAKVNTHVHTNKSDGDSSPEEVANWYADHGYHAVFWTDHNIGTKYKSSRIIAITGNEISTAVLHTGFLDNQIKVINHPQFRHRLTIEDILNYPDYNGIEIYNPIGVYYSKTSNFTMEEAWNIALENNILLYGYAGDDNHRFKNGKHNAGAAWIMVRVESMDEDSIVNAMVAGDFYATTGVYLSEYSTDPYGMQVDHNKTEADICGFELITAGDYIRGKVTCLMPSGNEIYAWGQPVKY